MIRRGVLGAGRRLLAVAVLALSARTVAAQDAALTELLFDLRIDRGPSRVVFALARDSTVLVGVRAFLDLAEIRLTDVFAGHYLRGVLEPGSRPFWFDTDGGTVATGVDTIPLEPADAVWRDGELYVITPIVARVFDVTFSVNAAELVILVQRATHLPAVRRMTRAGRRAVTEAAAAPASPGIVITPERNVVDGAVLDWGVTSLTETPLDAASLDLGLGMQVLGGSAIVTHVERRTTAGANRETHASWIRAFHTTPWLRQVRLGDVAGTGRVARLVRGAAVTNAPFLRPSLFAAEALRGMFDAGWEVELYRNEQLLGFTTSDQQGRYGFQVPVQYGPNPLEIVGYGPHGEIRRYERTFEISQLRLPRGQFEYGLGAGACVMEPCTTSANLDLRYGVTDRLTLQAGVDRFWRDTLPDLWHPYGVATGQLTRSVSLTGEAVANALYSGRLDLAPTPDVQTGIAHTVFENDVVAPLVGTAFERHRTDVFAFVRPGLLRDRFFARFTGFRSSGTIGTRVGARLTATSRFGGTRVDASTAVTWLRRPGIASAGTTEFEVRFFHVYLGRNRFFRRTLFQGVAGVNPDSGLSRVRLSATRTIAHAVQLDLGIDWQRGTDGITFEVGLATTLDALRGVSRNRINTAEGTRGTQTVEGSLIYERRRSRISFADGRALGRAGLTGVLFYDANANGVQDDDETAVIGVRIKIGPRTVATDSTGHFTVWDLIPFEPLGVEVDTLSIQDPLWRPIADRFTFRPDPNAFTTLPIPFQPAAEVSGRVRFEEGGAGLASVQIELVDPTTGDRYVTQTFSDGSFYLLGVRAGRYTVTVDPTILARLGAEQRPRTIDVRRGPDVIVGGVEVLVSRR